jgi:hypothetical protein
MKIFLGIESCDVDRRTHQQIRETWLAGCPIDYKFFLTRAPIDQRLDELVFPGTADGRSRLLQKFSREADYVLANGYDYFFRCQVDTYVHIPRLLRSGFEQYDYLGYGQGGWPLCAPFYYGGSGFWLSRKALLCLQETLKEPAWIKKVENCVDDTGIGIILEKHGIERISNQEHYRDHRPGPGPDNNCITFHESRFDIKDAHNLRKHRYLMEAHKIASQIQEGK